MTKSHFPQPPTVHRLSPVLDPVLDAIRPLLDRQERVLVAIDGRCGAGKTTLAARLQAELPCRVFHMDDFFLQPYQHTPERLQAPGENVDHERFLQEVLLPAARGADAVICLAHLGVDSSSEPNTSYDLLKNVPDIDFVIDGHSHSVMLAGAAKLQTGVDEDGKPIYIDNPYYELPIQSTGTKLAYVGVLIIDNKTKLPVGLEMLDLGQYE